MAKEEIIEMRGTVDEVLPDSRFRVTRSGTVTAVAFTGGKMKKHHIRILAGDQVSLELSPYRPEQGPHPSVICPAQRFRTGWPAAVTDPPDFTSGGP